VHTPAKKARTSRAPHAPPAKAASKAAKPAAARTGPAPAGAKPAALAPRRAAPAKVARKAQRGRAGKKAGGAAARRSNKREGETYKARRKLTRRKPDDAAVLEVACGAGVARHLAPVCFVTGCLRGEELSQADVRMLCVHSQSGQACPRIGQVYLHRVCKAVHPDLSISKRSMDVLQSFTADMFERLVAEAARITTKTGQATLTSREVRSPGAKAGVRQTLSETRMQALGSATEVRARSAQTCGWRADAL